MDPGATTAAADQQLHHSTVHDMLQQLAKSIAAVNHHQQQQMVCNQHAVEPPRTAPQQLQVQLFDGPGLILTTNPLQDLQDGLQAANQQLQSLLQQQGRAAQQTQQLEATAPLTSGNSAEATGQTTAATRSLATLQSLLQLAVGNSCDSSAPSAILQNSSRGSCAHALQSAVVQHSLQCGEQQQRWCQAAAEALQLFALAEIEQLSTSSLRQALLLQPQLLTELLQEAAAAVMQPLLCEGSSSSAASDRYSSTGLGKSSNAINSSSSSSAGSSIQRVLAGLCWWQALPGILADSPLLLMQASTSLISWLEASGHHRLWQLLSMTCRPAWQQLAAAAAAGTGAAAAACGEQQGQAALTSNKEDTYSNQDGSSDGSRQAVSAGALQLLCPAPWQQQLMQQLVQQPSIEGLLQLLLLLPGCCWPDEVLLLSAPQQLQTVGGFAALSHSQACAVRHPAALADAAAGNTGGVDHKHGRGSSEHTTSDGSNAALDWPSADDWGACWAQLISPASQTEQGAAGAAAGSEGRVPIDAATVVAAWGLTAQHLCWYQFACYLLVQCSLYQLQQEGQTQHHQRQGLHQSSNEQQQQLAAGLSHMQLAGCAAAFVAWVQEPVDGHQQHELWQHILLGIDKSATCLQHAGQQQANTGMAHKCCHLLAAWRTELGRWKQRGQHQQPHSTGADSCCTVGLTGFNLVDCDMPIAVMSQPELLLTCSAEQLFEVCFAPLQQQLHGCLQQQQQQATLTQPNLAPAHLPQQGFTSVAGLHGMDTGVAAAVVCQLLDSTDDVCTAALEVLSCSMQLRALRLQQQHMLEQQQTQQQHIASTCRNWLARQWLQVNSSSKDGCYDCSRQSVWELIVAKQLLEAATACDRHAKMLPGLLQC